nr:hypothetical protein [Kibdelosporangium sp. MJ126-NF4]
MAWPGWSHKSPNGADLWEGNEYGVSKRELKITNMSGVVWASALP